MEMGQAGEGMRQLARGAEEAPDSADLHLNLGLALVATGSAEEAVAPFERAAELAPTDPEPRAQLAAALHALGREAEALGAFQETLALAPRHLEQRPDLKAAYEASSLVDLRSRLRDELALPRARSRWLSSPLGFLLEALPTVPRRVGALMTVAALTLAASTSIGLARIYLHATAFREDVARIARSPVRDDSEILNRLMAVVDRHHLAGSIQPEQFVIESQRSFRRITCEYSVPFAAWLGARGRVPLRVDVDSPVLVPDEEVEIH